MNLFLIFNILSSTVGFSIQKSINLPDINGIFHEPKEQNADFNKPKEQGETNECQSGQVCPEDKRSSGLFFPDFSNLVTLISSTKKSMKQNRQTLEQPSFCGQVNLKSSQGRIVGGKEASEGQFPWLAQIWISKGASDKFICGGSLITDNVLVTAAHCIETTNVERFKSEIPEISEIS